MIYVKWLGVEESIKDGAAGAIGRSFQHDGVNVAKAALYEHWKSL